jgi:hypothetical protein
MKTPADFILIIRRFANYSFIVYRTYNLNMLIQNSIKTFILIGLFIFLIGEQEVQGQQKKKYLTVEDILVKLVFKSRFNKTIAEINKQLIENVQERKVDFTLDSEDENSLKRIGASDLLIKAIRENFSKILQDQIILYKKFTDNYAGSFEQKKIALEAAKEFIKKYSDDVDFKDIIEYFKRNIPVMEKSLNDIKNRDKTSNPNNL